MPFHILQFGPGDECFSWVDPDTGENLHFAVGKLREFVTLARKAGKQPSLIQLEPGHDKWLEENRGVDSKRSAALTDKELDDPLILCAMPPDHHVLVDGTHRMHRLITDGIFEAKVYLLPKQVWEHFLIEGIDIVLDDQSVLAIPTGDLPQRR